MSTITEPVALSRSPFRRGAVREVASGVACLPLSIVNVYFVGQADGGDRSWVLIDAGLGPSAGSIVRAAAERFGPGVRPAAIVLTHGHFDHVGSVIELARRWDAPVYAHELEMPYLTGRSSYPPPDPSVGGGMMSLLSPLYPRGPIDLGDRVERLPADRHVPAMPGWRWLHTPGHAPGHVSLFRDEDGVLIAGDAFVTVRQESALAVLTQRPQVWRPPAYYTTDWGEAGRSVKSLADLRPRLAATGHGPPLDGETLREGLELLSRDFGRFVASRGRYVHQPAVADARGVVSVPPPVPNPARIALAAFGLAAVAGLLLLRSRRR